MTRNVAVAFFAPGARSVGLHVAVGGLGVILIRIAVQEIAGGGCAHVEIGFIPTMDTTKSSFISYFGVFTD